MADINFLAVIPARGGSKRIPGKNLATVAGRPLISWTIHAALGCPQLDRVIVSSDDPEIIEVAKKCGAEAPFTRPPQLAADRSKMLPVLQHSLACIESDYSVDAIVLLQPTSPLRNSKHISQAIEIFKEKSPQSVVSVTEPPHIFHPWKLMISDDSGLRNFMNNEYKLGDEKTILPKVFGRNGPAILITSATAIKAGELYPNPCLPYIMDRGESIDIDDPSDLAYVEHALLNSSRRLYSD